MPTRRTFIELIEDESGLSCIIAGQPTHAGNADLIITLDKGEKRVTMFNRNNEKIDDLVFVHLSRAGFYFQARVDEALALRVQSMRLRLRED